ncbi:MAG: phosphotransferase [Dehalococcoidia bacterium]
MVEQPPLVQALLTPAAYPHHPEKIEMVQTQMSFIFLTGDYVYKVKKPVDLGYLDYTTLEKRKHFCHQEVILNRRLCPGVYLDVVPIIEDKGNISIEGRGEAIEYAVKMRQLPQERTMDHLLKNNQVTREMVEQVAQRLASFHQEAETNEMIASYGDLNILATNTEENFTQTEKYIGVTISPGKYDVIKSYTEAFLKENTALFRQRMRDDRIRDCHGDLHAAHVCFTNGICIFDCIEFNERFRFSDVANEVAFLAMDLDYHGRTDLSRHFVESYMEASGDQEMMKLLDYYKCYRAYVRGKVESFKLDDPLIPAEEKARGKDIARRYFDLAQSYIPKDN